MNHHLSAVLTNVRTTIVLDHAALHNKLNSRSEPTQILLFQMDFDEEEYLN